MQQQQVQFLQKQKNYYQYKKPTPKKYIKVVYQEQSEKDPEFEKEQVESESKQIAKEPEIKKATSKKRNGNTNIYDYINRNAKRNKR